MNLEGDREISAILDGVNKFRRLHPDAIPRFVADSETFRRLIAKKDSRGVYISRLRRDCSGWTILGMPATKDDDVDGWGIFDE